MKTRNLLFSVLLLVNATLWAQQETTVSAMAATASVSQTGAANYQIPIEVPPGTNGVQPNIGIAYNSQGSFGAMGIGWDISGLSAITRGVKNFYYDTGAISHHTVKFSNEDQLYLDGQRLIYLAGESTGAHFQDGAVYGTEVENYSRVTIKTDNSKIYFELKTLDGQILEYGKGNAEYRSANNDIFGNAPNYVLAWKISKATDVFGNSIDYEYSAKGKNLTKITYAGGENEIEFTYILNNKNPQRRYIGNFYAVNNTLLSEIITKNGGAEVKKYGLTYANADTYKHLTEISEYLDGHLLNTTNIEWGQASEIQEKHIGFAYDSNLPKDEQSLYTLYSGDIDGDGYPDLIEFSRGYNFAGKVGYIKVKLKNGDLDAITFSNASNYFKSSLVIGDVDGDGKDEIYLLRTTALQNTTLRIVEKYELINNVLELTSQQEFPFNGGIDVGYQAFLINKNGDQYPDLAIVPYWYSNTDYHNGGRIGNAGDIVTLAGQANGTLGTPVSSTLDLVSDNQRGAWHHPLIGDFDANGVPDILHTLCKDPDDHPSLHSYNGFNVKLSRNWGDNLYKEETGHYDVQTFETLHPIDANNDGRTDILVHRNKKYDPKGDRYKWHILQSNGLDDVPKQTSLLPLPVCKVDSKKGNRYYPIVLDYNGDGMQDIVLATEVNTGFYDVPADWWGGSAHRVYTFRTDWYFYKNNNGVFTLEYYTTTPNRLSLMQPAIIDINNDGIQDLVYLEEYGNQYRAFTMPNANKLHLVHSITDGMGQTDQFSYRYNDYYELPASGDVRTLNAPVIMVSQHIQPNGERTEYNFLKAKYHKTKGFLGFEKTIATNFTQEVTTENSYQYSADYCNMYLEKQQIYTFKCQDNSPPQVSTTMYENYNIAMGGKRYMPVTEKITATNHIAGTVKIIEYGHQKNGEMPNKGNLLNETVTEDDFITLTEYDNFVAKNGSIIAYLPESKKVTFKKQGSNDIEYETRFDYNNLGQIENQFDFYNKQEQIVTNYAYYPTGNLHVETVHVPNLTPQVTEYEYDALFRLPVKITNTAGDFATKDYCFASGNIINETGIDGLTTTYNYNFAGQLKEKEMPNGQKITYTRAYDTAHGAKYKITEAMNAPALTTTTFYDIYGSDVYKTQTGANGNLLHSRNTYDYKHRLDTAILPHEISETNPAFVKYKYDCYGRVKEEEKFDRINTLITGYDYDGLTTAITNPDGTEQTITKNTKGLVVLRSDEGGKIEYDYNAEGKPITIIAADDSKTIIKYDEYGYQQALDDPNAGTLYYQYHLNGLLQQQKNAKGDVTEIFYDNLWREQEKTINGQALRYVYNYVPSGKGIGKIEYVEYFENGNLIHLQNFMYDSNHLLVEKTDSYEWVDYTFKYSYDDLWRLKIKQSPSGLVVENFYNPYGQIDMVTANNETVWNLNHQNAKGQIIDFTLGNGIIKSSYKYYDNGLLNTIYSEKNGNVLQDLVYDYDSRYNLTSRINNRLAAQENFVYDKLNRLTECYYDGTLVLNTNYYHENGNIKNKSDVGEYGYGSKQPHAVIAIDEGGQSTGDGITDDIQILEYTPFNKVSLVHQIYKNGDEDIYEISYGASQQRIRTIYTKNWQEKFIRYYFGSFEIEQNPDGEMVTDYIFAPTGLCAIFRYGKPLYVLNDNMGSVQIVTNDDADIINEWYYTPWGGRTRIDDTGHDFTDRGYTGHEHLSALGLINMNGRIYDPTLARFLSPDPYVQAPDFTQGFNRYSYCLNNPFKFTDPNGEKLKWWQGLLIGLGIDMLTGGAISSFGLISASMAAPTIGATVGGTAVAAFSTVDLATGGTLSITAATVFPFTRQSYELQKYISPFAINTSFEFGNGRSSFDFDISIGVPRIFPVSGRVAAGGSYIFRDYDNMYSGWEGRYGWEAGMYTFTYTGLERTWYNRRGTEFDQIRDKMTVGTPWSPIFIQNDNDFLIGRSGGSDKYYTQGIRIVLGGLLDIGLDMVTGRALGDKNDEGPYGTYITEINKHRAGILSFRFGPFRFGYNSEGIRNTFQNGWHDLPFIATPRFHIDPNIQGGFYWTFGGW